jgi:uncharacterized protein YbjT (DUF2867 family)
MILITGGRGAVATHLRNLLHKDGLPVRVASTDPTQLRVADGIATAALDLTQPATFPDALSGIAQVFLYATADHIDEFIDQAAKASVTHVVLLSSASVLNRNPERDLLAKSHLDVEQALLASPISTTILRPGSFASNAGAWAWPIKNAQPVSLPYPGSFNDPIHEADVAEVAHAVLTNADLRTGQFHLTGPETVTFAQQIDQIATALGHPISFNHVTREQWKQEMADYVSGPLADALLDWWAANDGKPAALTNAVPELTGHPGRPFTTWIADHINDFKSP